MSVGVLPGDVAELSAEAVLAEAERAQVAMVAAETRRLVLAARWLELHCGEMLRARRAAEGGRVLQGTERVKPAGGDGTPSVSEFAAMELGAVLGMGPVAADCFLRDAANLRFRHPRLWAELCAGQVRVWQAREIARRCAAAGLDAAQAGWVDAVTTPRLGSLPWARFESVLAGRIVAVDPAGAEQRRREASLERFVRTGRSEEFGLRTVVARAEAGDAVFFMAMVDRIAQVLAERGDTDPVGVRRSKALGVLANPARAWLLLTESAAAHAEQDDNDGDGEDEQPAEAPSNDTSSGDGSGDGDADTLDDDDAELAGEAAAGSEPEPEPVGGLESDLQHAASSPWQQALARSLQRGARGVVPEARLYVHLSQAAVESGAGVARLEDGHGGSAAVTVQQVRELLGHCRVRVVPVLDVAGQEPVDGYEVPARMREALHLRGPASGVPWSSHRSRRKDADHVVPYLPRARGGPAGQTALGNLAWLDRRGHRVKTHGRWRLRQPRPGVLVWRTPHGYRFKVDHTGTHPLGREPASPMERQLQDLVHDIA